MILCHLPTVKMLVLLLFQRLHGGSPTVWIKRAGIVIDVPTPAKVRNQNAVCTDRTLRGNLPQHCLDFRQGDARKPKTDDSRWLDQGTLPNRAVFAGSSSLISVPTSRIHAYIQNQKAHHRDGTTHTYWEETGEEEQGVFNPQHSQGKRI